MPGPDETALTTTTTTPRLLSILMPAYNEKYSIHTIVDRALAVPLPEGIQREVVIVDDGSTDGTREILPKLERKHEGRVRVFLHEKNQGKGAALRTAIQHARGDIAVIQDADLEYDPRDFCALLEPILAGDADVVYGSRFLGGSRRRVLYYWHSVGNRFLTTLSNIFTNLNLTDMETCYKVARMQLLKSIPLRCNRFGIEPEMTAKFAKRQARIYELPIAYKGRTYQEGKKIKWGDGVKAVFVILWFWVVDDIFNATHGHDILYNLSKTPRFNRWMADAIKPYVGERVLEIGSGLGNLTAQLLPRQVYTASDIDPLYLDFLASHYRDDPVVNVARIDLMRADDFASHQGAFDTVVCLNVVEHVDPDVTALAHIRSALTPEGRAIILVPHGPGLYCSFDRVLGHHRRYTAKMLRARAEEAGFQVDRMFSFNRIGVLGWLLNGKLLRRERFGRLQLKIYDTFVWVWRLLERVLPWRGLSLVLIARNPADTSAD